MIRLDAERPVHFCDGMTRRDFLRAGALTAFGLSLADLFRLRAAHAAIAKSEISCIHLFLVGGPSQLDTFDPKPDAPVEVRSPFAAMKTRAPGVLVTEAFPRLAANADKVAFVRSVHHTAAAIHETGHQMMQTGRLFQGGVEHPHIGAVYAKLKGAKGALPPYVALPFPIGNTGVAVPHGQSAGYLGETFDPFVIAGDPSQPDYQPTFEPPAAIAAVRQEQGKTFRQMVDKAVRGFETSPEADLLDPATQQAYTIISSSEARAAFDLSKEPDQLRDRYGRNRFGQSCLMARRLVERGVRFATVNMFDTVFNDITWDIHGSAPFSPISAVRDVVGPMFDNAFATLLEDLQDKGMLENTLVCAHGEFGRTPKINPAGGRDHWPQVWTVLFAGGPIKGGQAIGSSDESGAFPKDRPVTPAEVVASVYHALGVDLDTELSDAQGGTTRLVEQGVEPIRELF